jgi:hypothetical protein
MVRPDTIILPEPNIDSDLRLSCSEELFRVELSFRKVPLKRSLYQFSQGDTGRFALV